MTTSIAKDLFVLTADSQLRHAIETLLVYRRRSLNIRDISFDVLRHPRSDAGCRVGAASFLRQLQGNYRKVIVTLDFEGSGASNTTPSELEELMERQILSSGWELDNVAVIVIEPELEAWLFGTTFQHLEQTMKWSNPAPMREWLEINQFLSTGIVKPTNPKAAVEALLLQAGKSRSGKLYRDIARITGLARCQDRAFQKFHSTLQGWFPAS